jgi:hypothetical protein
MRSQSITRIDGYRFALDCFASDCLASGCFASGAWSTARQAFGSCASVGPTLGFAGSFGSGSGLGWMIESLNQ